MRTTLCAGWGLLMLSALACSDRGLVAAEGTDGGEPGDDTGVVPGTGGVSSGGRGSGGTAGSDPASGGGDEEPGSTGGAPGTGGTGNGGATDTGGTSTGGATDTGGTTSGGTGTGGTAGTGGADGGSGGSAGSTVCSTDACCAGVELRQQSLVVYLVDDELYFDATVDLISGPLDLDRWFTTVEISSEQTGALEGPMPNYQGSATRAYWAASPGAASSTVTCGQVLTVQARVRTNAQWVDTQGMMTQCNGVYGPSITVEVTVECPTCPADAGTETAVCRYPRALVCPGTSYGMDGQPLIVGCSCYGIGEPRHWSCPVA